jgi:hypothetical protein
LYTLAIELDTDKVTRGEASSSRGQTLTRSTAASGTLANSYIPLLVQGQATLLTLVHPVVCWVQGCGLQASLNGDAYNGKTIIEDVHFLHPAEVAEHIAFAQYYKPSPQMVSRMKYSAGFGMQ